MGASAGMPDHRQSPTYTRGVNTPDRPPAWESRNTAAVNWLLEPTLFLSLAPLSAVHSDAALLRLSTSIDRRNRIYRKPGVANVHTWCIIPSFCRLPRRNAPSPCRHRNILVQRIALKLPFRPTDDGRLQSVWRVAGGEWRVDHANIVDAYC